LPARAPDPGAARSREAVRLAAWFAAALLACLWLIPSVAHGSTVTTAICRTFGPYCGQALRVAWCESRYDVYARSRYGHWGLFQFDANARRTYGFSWDAWGQSRAAYRYFRAAGYSWRPWSCRP
jgi:hypothetical protein